MAVPSDREASVLFPCDKWAWSSSSALSDVQPVRWSADGLARKRAIWRDNVTKAGHLIHSNTIVLLGLVSNYVSATEGYAFPSIDRLAADLGWSRSPVERALKEGKSSGWLEWCKPYFKDTNAYRLSYSPRMVAAIREHLALRMEAIDRAITSKVTWLDGDANHIRSDRQITSELTDQSRQIRGTILSREPLKGYSEERLGDETKGVGSPRETLVPSESPLPALLDEVEAELSARDELIRALGDGDVPTGRLLADTLGPPRCSFLIQEIIDVGPRRARVAIREAAADARSRLASSASQPGAV